MLCIASCSLPDSSSCIWLAAFCASTKAFCSCSCRRCFPTTPSASGVVGKHRRLLVVVRPHLLQLGALLVEVRALLRQLRLQARPRRLAFLDFLDGALDVDVPDLHRLRGGGPGSECDGESKQKTAHLSSFSPVLGPAHPNGMGPWGQDRTRPRAIGPKLPSAAGPRKSSRW